MVALLPKRRPSSRAPQAQATTEGWFSFLDPSRLRALGTWRRKMPSLFKMWPFHSPTQKEVISCLSSSVEYELCGNLRESILVRLFITSAVYLIRVFRCKRGRESSLRTSPSQLHIIVGRGGGRLVLKKMQGLESGKQRVCLEPGSKEPWTPLHPVLRWVQRKQIAGAEECCRLFHLGTNGAAWLVVLAQHA